MIVFLIKEKCYNVIIMFDALFYNPIYNFVVFLLNYIPDAGIVIIITTVFIKLILFPFHKKQIQTQIATKKAKPKLDALKEKYGKKASPENKQKMMMETMAIYKEYQIKPFANILVLFIQLPAIFALYWVFYKGGLPDIDLESVYSFIQIPKDITMSFLGKIDLSETNIILAVLAALSQYAHSMISMPESKIGEVFKGAEKADDGSFKNTLKQDLSKSFQVSIKYGMPIFIFVLLSTTLNAAVAIYWTTSNVFQVMQEFLVRKEKKEKKEEEENESKK